MARTPTHGPGRAETQTYDPTPRRVVFRIGPLPPGLPDLPYRDGVEAFLVEHRVLPEWTALEREFPGVTLKRLFFTLTPTELAAFQAPALNQMPDTFHDLLRHFYVDTPDGGDPRRLLELIRAIPIIAEAYLEAPLAPPPSPPPGIALYQDYLDAAPTGIGARVVRGVYPNARGEGTKFADIEQGWYLFDDGSGEPYVNHEDLLPPAGAPLLRKVVMPAWAGACGLLMSADHGTSVIGVIRAIEDADDCTGVAPQSNGICVCEVAANSSSSRADRITAAAANLDVGDVLLLEVQIGDGSGDPDQYYPVEIQPSDRNAIAAATARGIVVIEATGDGADTGADKNGQVAPGKGDLDQRFPSLRPGTDEFLDTGAVLVTCASSGMPHDRLPTLTRYGRRVDCFAWGEQVATTHNSLASGCSNSVTATQYRTNFGGSSSASAIVAGAALVVQSLHRHEYGFPASPWRVRALLRDPATGTAPAAAAAPIGVMPDLARIAPVVVPRVKPEIYIRDFVGDTGQPHTGPISNSPDIIVKRVAVGNPTGAFGPPSGSENDDNLSDSVRAGQEHSLYVRLRNLAQWGSGPVEVNVYWAEPATLITPLMWHHIGADHTMPSVVIPSVPGGDVLTVSDRITWLANEVPASGHYCFVALVGCAGDPAPHPIYLGDWAVFIDFIRNNNNVTWRNFNVINLATMLNADAIPFLVAAAPNRAVRMILEANGDLPPGVRVEVHVPPELDVYLDRRTPGDPRAGDTVVLDFARTRGRPIEIGAGVLPPGGRWRCALRLVGQPPPQPVDGEVWIRQLCVVEDRAVEVGRITWRFTD